MHSIFVDYILWKNREELGRKYKKYKIDQFKFAYRRSIEHWFPQHPNSDERVEKMDDQFLHSLGTFVSLQIVKIRNLGI